MKLIIGAKLLIVFTDWSQFVCLTRRRVDHLSWKEKFDIPGGKAKEGEEPLDALKRELIEEINFKLTDDPELVDASSIINNDEIQVVRLTYLIEYDLRFLDVELGSEHGAIALRPFCEDAGFHPVLNRAIRHALSRRRRYNLELKAPRG